MTEEATVGTEPSIESKFKEFVASKILPRDESLPSEAVNTEGTVESDLIRKAELRVQLQGLLLKLDGLDRGPQETEADEQSLLFIINSAVSILSGRRFIFLYLIIFTFCY